MYVVKKKITLHPHTVDHLHMFNCENNLQARYVLNIKKMSSLVFDLEASKECLKDI